MKRLERDKARELRQKGISILEIAKQLNVSKASVSVWVRDVELSEQDRKRLSKGGRSVESIERRRVSRIANTQGRYRTIRDAAKLEIPTLSRQELLILGTALYWGEGSKKSKGMVSISNSDPTVIKIMMRFFDEIYDIPLIRVKAHVHTFSHLNVKDAENYWSKVSGIPLSQFYKTYSKPSIASKNKKDSLPYGTLAIYICDTNLLQRTLGLIERLGEFAEK